MLTVWGGSGSSWDELHRNSGNFFARSAWQSVLQRGFGSTFVRACWAGQPIGAITIFHAGPLRVGYLNFPVGYPNQLGWPNCRVVALRKELSSIGIDVLRFQCHEPLSGYRCSTPLKRTWISDLGNWDVAKHVKARRTQNKRNRGRLQIRPAKDTDAHVIFKLYQATIVRHSGSRRYDLPYFQAVIETSTVNDDISVLVAQSGDDVAGFVAFTAGSPLACYLHGAYSLDFRHEYPSDILFLEMLETARAKGSTAFDFLASPMDQPTLTGYKEKWGGTTELLYPYSLSRRAWLGWVLSLGQRAEHLLLSTMVRRSGTNSR